MDVREQENRKGALGHACRHRLSTEQPEDVVKAAEKYFAFLQDKLDDEPTGGVQTTRHE